MKYAQLTSILLILFLAAIVIFFSVPGNENKSISDSNTVIISGHVFECDGSGVGGVTVHILGGMALTDSAGRFELTAVKNVSITVKPSLDGYTFYPENKSFGTVSSDYYHVFTALRIIDPSIMTFADIPGGTFLMGDDGDAAYTWEQPVHRVTVAPFRIGVYEVTNAQYARFLNDALAEGDVEVTERSGNICAIGAAGEMNGKILFAIDSDSPFLCEICYSDSAFYVQPCSANRPVRYVSWYGAHGFAEYYGYDLPTEAQWEYACRGGVQLPYGTADGTIGIETANYNSNKFFADVGSYPSNPFGLYDMSGNVREWCRDYYGIDYYSVSPPNDPEGPSWSYTKVIRGGGWGDKEHECRSAYRAGGGLEEVNFNYGFRVVERF